MNFDSDSISNPERESLILGTCNCMIEVAMTDAHDIITNFKRAPR